MNKDNGPKEACSVALTGKERSGAENFVPAKHGNGDEALKQVA